MKTISISGELDTDNVPDRLRESAQWFHGTQAIAVDLAGVTRADSAGIALLLEWLRQAHAANAGLSFHNAPAQMHAIIDFCALGDVIPLSDTPPAG